MPLVRSSASKHHARVIAVILLLSEIMPTCFYCVLKGLICIAIIAPLGCQPSSYTKCTKSNMHLSCNVKSVSNAKYTCLIHSYILRNLQLPYLICLRVSHNSYYKKTQF